MTLRKIERIGLPGPSTRQTWKQSEKSSCRRTARVLAAMFAFEREVNAATYAADPHHIPSFETFVPILIEGLRRLGLGSKLRYVANKMRDGYSLNEPMGDLAGTLAARIPFDAAFDVAENRHQPLVLSSDGTTRQAILRLAASVYPALERVSPGRGIKQPFSWLSRRRRAS